MVDTIPANRVEASKNLDADVVWKELLIAFIVSLPFFTHGVETNTLTSSAHSGHFISSVDTSWSTTALIVGAGVSAPIYCYVIDKFGRRVGIFIVNFSQGASLVPLFLLNETNTIVLHIFAGIALGGLLTVTPTYIREVCSQRIRGFTLSLMMAMTTTGYMMKLAMSLESLLYLMVTLVVVQFILMLCLMESPSYLVMVGKLERAKASIAKLKCLSDDNPGLSKCVNDFKDESEKARTHGKLTIIAVYRNKIWWDSIKVGFLLYTTMVLCGSTLFLDQQKTLMQMRVPSDPNSTLVLSSLLAGSLITVVCSMFLDRKIILTLGYTTMALSSGVLAVYTQVDLTVTTLTWVPIVSLVVLVLGYGVSWALPVIIMVEVFTFEIRTTLLGIIFAYSQILKLIHVHTFQYIEDYVGIYTMFYIFAGINLYGAVYTFFVVPTTKNKNVRQIEKQMKRIPLPA